MICRTSVRWFCGLLIVGISQSFAQDSEHPVRFAHDVRPLLSEHCFQCHGPDENKRQADLRLDREKDAKSPIDGRFAIAPGDPDRSEMLRRMTSDDPDLRMPPAETGKRLSPAEIETIRRWILEGARWEKHWSFVEPARGQPPSSSSETFARSPLDLFVQKKLKDVGLAASDQADREALLRRVTIALTGLPPTLDELDEFLRDESPNAYERVVDRLLASPRYGERMAWMWLDAARYADTSGYQNDGPRSMWRWRDWVIEAFNANTPFDQFTVEQLAGDLLPNATREQRIATGFNRNHRGNAEGGIIAEEYQVEYVVDRVDTTCTVWLGLTMGCARCHDHKYDPLSQKEFYQLFAFFNNVPEYGRAIKEGNSPPYIQAPTPFQEQRLARLDEDLRHAEEQWQAAQAEVDRGQALWELAFDKMAPTDYSVTRGLVASFDCEPDCFKDISGGQPAEGTSTSNDASPAASFIDGRKGQAVKLDGHSVIRAGDVANFGYFDKFSITFWTRPSALNGTIVSRMTDEEQGDGWYVQLQDGKLQVNLVKRWLDDAIRIESETTVPPESWFHVAITYDGSRLASGIVVYMNGERIATRTKYDFLNQTFTTKEPLRIGGGNGPSGRFFGAIDELGIYQRVLESDEVSILATPEEIQAIAGIPADKRTQGQKNKVRAYYLATAAPADVRSRSDQVVELREQRRNFVESLPTVMVMQEMEKARDTHVLVRGDYTKPGEKVLPGVPACLPPSESRAASDRLGFAKWLVARENPLTSRVFVNRIWQLHFGNGLVRSTEDFGMQGEPPTHPELLDWLASEFIDGGWDVKNLHRTIVTSATYRQSSRATSEPLSKDPDNRWLSRGPRFRYSAEVIRDQALAVSGLLVDRLGGPSVKPYQPADLWKDLATDTVYDQDHGANLYRRSLYTYWKRTVAPPSMMTFDAAGREACQVRQSRTNTPLQALTLLNDVTYVEAARVLAQRVLLLSNGSPEDRLSIAFRLATSRNPKESELRILVDALQHQVEHFQQSPAEADKLLSQGEFPRDANHSAVETAAYAAVCSILLNLDEVIMLQ